MTKRSIRKSIAFAIALTVFSCHKEKRLFEKLEASDSGIAFENKLNPTEDFNIIDYIYFYNGGGVAVGDINGDSLPDIFLSGNQVPNKLYLNKGNLKFEDITDHAGVAGSSTWKTGSIMGDVNADGLLDIYVCAVVGLKHLSGHNELYINNGDNTFTEKSAEYGLDFESYSSTAAFLDFDLDGDLDMYLLNHAIHTPESFGHSNLRNQRTYESGGKLLRNDNGKFTDVSEQAKIFGGVNGYGLGLAVSDVNMDGYPDIFVGNDFHEDDYLYINNRDGTFFEDGKRALTAMSKFSMGNDVADVNHDGFPDLISLDMLPEDEKILKRSVDEENISIMKLRTEKYGYGYQFPRNMLHINQGNGQFSETALMSRVAATDWSWSALFADYDQDGHQDLFISNGIPRRPNDLDYIKYVSSEQVQKTIETTKLVDEKALALMPEGKAQNCIFKGDGEFEFKNMSDAWLPEEKTCATATALSDLDNDGDLDIVVNNVDEPAGIYVNQCNTDAHFLKIRIKYSAPNPFGIGTKVYSYHDGILQYKELYTARGFQASSEPLIHFGYGKTQVIDSLRIIWPNGKSQRLSNVTTNQTLVISPVKKLESISFSNPKLTNQIFDQIDPKVIGLTYQHVEDNYTDFDRLKLLPYQQSDRGPATAIGDLNGDGLTDVFFGGSKFKSAQIFTQTAQSFVKSMIPEILKDSVKEDVDAVIADFNKDGKNDLFVGSGGADFYGRALQLQDNYYLSSDSGFNSKTIEKYFENASCVKATDFDKDGDIDLFVGSESVSNDFGRLPISCMLRNSNGNFEPFQVELFASLGMITDAAWDDFDKDGKVDLIVVGEWMQPVFLKNTGNSFEKADLTGDGLNGLWQSVIPFDIDSDGDTDYVLGNWGMNSKFWASASQPMRMYYNDFDKNGKFETIVAIAKKGAYYPLDGFDMIASQIPALRKKYTAYESFAGKTIEQVFTDEELKTSSRFEVHELASGYLKNDQGQFSFVRLPMDLQVSPIMAMVRFDFDQDGNEEVLAAGNYFGVQPFHGRFASFSGAIIKNPKEIIPGHRAGLNLMNKSARQLNVISFSGSNYLIVTLNNDSAQVYKLRTLK
jgi:enediyne biosynthesis protein E4